MTTSKSTERKFKEKTELNRFLNAKSHQNSAITNYQYCS